MASCFASILIIGAIFVIKSAIELIAGIPKYVAQNAYVFGIIMLIIPAVIIWFFINGKIYKTIIRKIGRK